MAMDVTPVVTVLTLPSGNSSNSNILYQLRDGFDMKDPFGSWWKSRGDTVATLCSQKSKSH